MPDETKNVKNQKTNWYSFPSFEINDLNNEKVLSSLLKFINTLPFYVLVVDFCNNKYKTLLINDQMAKSIGTTVNEIIGKDIREYLEKEVKQKRLKYAKRMIETKQPQFFEDKKENRYFSNEFYPHVDKNGIIDYGLALVRDITRQKQEEQKKIGRKEAYYQSLIQNSMDIITVINKKEEITYISPSIKKILGYTPKERLGKNVFENVHPLDQEKLKKYFSEISSTSNPTKKIVIRIKDKQGKWHYLESIGNNQLNNPQINGLIINSRDITNRLKQEMEKNAILDNTSEIIAYHDLNHNIIWANKAYQKETGLSLEELIGRKCFHAWGLNQECKNCPTTKALQTGKSQQAVFSPDSQKNWPSHFKTWLIKADPVINENDQIIGVIELSYDITQQRRANEEIKRTKEYFEKLVNNTSEIIFTIDKNYRIILWNKTAENITGIKAKKIVGRDIRKIDNFENSSEITTFLNQRLNGQPATIDEIIIKTFFGSKRLVNVSPSIVKDQKNNITDVIFICNDITMKDATHGKLVTSRSYLIIDDTMETTFSIFNNLINANQKGLFITRMQYEKAIQHINKKHASIVLLSPTSMEAVKTIQSLKELKEQIKKFVTENKNGVICINRSDYLFTLYGYQDVLITLYDINDIIRKNKALFLFQVNNELLDKNQLQTLKEEFYSLPSKEIKQIFLDDRLFEMLRYIYEQNQSNNRVYQKNLCSQLSISKVTAQKRIDELINKGLILSKKQGRIKNLYITNKGKEMLRKGTSM